jgi:hypothetical protein
MKKWTYIIVLFLFSVFAKELWAQQAPDQEDSVEEGEVVELGAVDIRVQVEAPQVSMISDRIKPKFDDVHLEKSFLREIVGAGEKIIIENEKKRSLHKRIDLDKLLKKTR